MRDHDVAEASRAAATVKATEPVLMAVCCFVIILALVCRRRTRHGLSAAPCRADSATMDRRCARCPSFRHNRLDRTPDVPILAGADVAHMALPDRHRPCHQWALLSH